MTIDQFSNFRSGSLLVRVTDYFPNILDILKVKVLVASPYMQEHANFSVQTHEYALSIHLNILYKEVDLEQCSLLDNNIYFNNSILLLIFHSFELCLGLSTIYLNFVSKFKFHLLCLF